MKSTAGGMPTYFILTKLQEGYTWKDFELLDFDFEYAVDVLGIPDECLESVECTGRELEITLVQDKTIVAEDWYYALCCEAEEYAASA
jgi:hypothetical protein